MAVAVISNLIIFILETVKYLTAYYICFSKKIKDMRVIGGAACLLILTYLIFAEQNGSMRYIVACGYVLLSIYLMMKEHWKQKIVNLFEILFFVLCIDEAWGKAVKLIAMFYDVESGIENWKTMVMDLGTVCVLGMIAFVKSRKEGIGKKIWSKVTSKLHYFVALMVLEMLFTISGLGEVAKYVPRPEIRMFINILCIVAYMGVGVLGISVIEIRRVNHKMEELLQREIFMNNMQEYYYSTLLEKEEDTRRYRHDMSNHIMVLSSMAEKKEIENVSEYLKKLQEQMIHIQRKNYVTGNQTLDIITNYHLVRLQEQVIVQIEGRIIQEIGIDNMVLCTIYANLLQNAIEELEKNGEGKFLKIKLEEGKEFVRIQIQNSLSDESRQKRKLLKSHKEDKRNHGIGLRNVQEAVNECGGKLELVREEKSFTAQVILRKN